MLGSLEREKSGYYWGDGGFGPFGPAVCVRKRQRDGGGYNFENGQKLPKNRAQIAAL